MQNKKLVCGIGINDADYRVSIRKEAEKVNGKRKQELIFSCPFYETWSRMLRRCYDEKYQKHRPTYKDCYVCDEWKYFMNFKRWMETQDWEGKQLDKDILIEGNRVYGPDTCCFVTGAVNNFILEPTIGSGMVGCYFRKDFGKYYAQCRDTTGGMIYLGVYDSEEEAHFAWLETKLKLAYEILEAIDDKRVGLALVKRYENYPTRKKHTPSEFSFDVLMNNLKLGEKV